MNSSYTNGNPEWADSDTDVELLVGLTGPEFGLSAEEATQQAAARQQADQWSAIRSATLVAAAEAIKARNWQAKREALALSEQAHKRMDLMVRTIFGTGGEVPARYADLVEMGRRVTSAQVAEANSVIRADAAAEDSAAERRITAAARSARPTAASRAAAATRLADEKAARESEKADLARRDAEQRAEDLAAGMAALPEMVSVAIGCEWIEEDGAILADDGREYRRLVVSAVVATDIGRMVRCANSRASEVVRLAGVMRSHIIKESA